MPNDKDQAQQIVSRIKRIDWDKVDKELDTSGIEESTAPTVTFDNAMGEGGPKGQPNTPSAPQDIPRRHPGVWKTTTGNRRSFNAP